MMSRASAKSLPYGREAAPVASRHRPSMPRLYSGKFLAQTLLQATLVLLLIEAIFLTEKLNDVLRSAIDQHASIGSIILLLLFRTPDVFGLALPLALTIAVYRVTLRFREDRELLILSGMGIGTHQFVWLALVLGLAAQMLSLLVSGVVSPAATFAQRQLLFEAHYTALRGGISAGQFYRFGEYTVFAGPKRLKTDERHVFLHKASDDDDQIIIANRASLEGPRADGSMTLHLRDLSSTSFPAAGRAEYSTPTDASRAVCDRCGNERVFEPTASTNVGNLSQEIALDDLFKFEPRGTRLSERTLLDLVGFDSSNKTPGINEVSEFGRRIGRSFLCLIGPLIAGIALAFTTRATHIVALPLACAILMGVDLALGILTDAIAGFGLSTIVILLVVVTLALFAGVSIWFSSWQNALVKPGLGRA